MLHAAKLTLPPERRTASSTHGATAAMPAEMLHPKVSTESRTLTPRSVCENHSPVGILVAVEDRYVASMVMNTR